MIANYKKISDLDYDKINTYSNNNQVSIWAKSSVEGMIAKEYMCRYSNGTFKPKGKITRVEAVVKLNRVKLKTSIINFIDVFSFTNKLSKRK